MAKLDKQGLNTFIRELDKHINTKINRLDITPKAEKVTIADTEGLFEATNVEDALLENKTSILNNTNLANQALSKANEAFLRGDNVKTQLVDKLISEGLDVSTNNTFEELIGSIALGKKWASGVINSGATKRSFEFLNSASTSLDYSAKITNLDFVPSIVIATSDYSNNYYGYLSMFYLFGEQKRFYCCNNASYRDVSSSLTCVYKEKNGLQCDSTGVTLPFAINNCNYTWIAIE